MSKQATSRKDPYPIRGETIGQRKRDVQRLMKKLGCEIPLSDIKQQNGELSITWFPPFKEGFMQQLAIFSEYGVVLFWPEHQKAEVAFVNLIFEREPGLFLYGSLLRHAIFFETIDRLPDLLAQYVQLYAQREQERDRAREDHTEPEPELEQGELFPEEK